MFHDLDSQLPGEQSKNRAAVSALKQSSSMKIPNNQCSHSICKFFFDLLHQHLPTCLRITDSINNRNLSNAFCSFLLFTSSKLSTNVRIHEFPVSFLETTGGFVFSTHGCNIPARLAGSMPPCTFPKLWSRSYALIWCGGAAPELVYYPYLTLNRFSFTVNDSVWSHYTVRARVSLHHFKLNSTHASSHQEDIAYWGGT